LNVQIAGGGVAVFVLVARSTGSLPDGRIGIDPVSGVAEFVLEEASASNVNATDGIVARVSKAPVISAVGSGDRRGTVDRRHDAALDDIASGSSAKRVIANEGNVLATIDRSGGVVAAIDGAGVGIIAGLENVRADSSEARIDRAGDSVVAVNSGGGAVSAGDITRGREAEVGNGAVARCVYARGDGSGGGAAVGSARILIITIDGNYGAASINGRANVGLARVGRRAERDERAGVSSGSG